MVSTWSWSDNPWVSIESYLIHGVYHVEHMACEWSTKKLDAIYLVMLSLWKTQWPPRELWLWGNHVFCIVEPGTFLDHFWNSSSKVRINMNRSQGRTFDFHFDFECKINLRQLQEISLALVLLRKKSQANDHINQSQLIINTAQDEKTALQGGWPGNKNPTDEWFIRWMNGWRMTPVTEGGLSQTNWVYLGGTPKIARLFLSGPRQSVKMEIQIQIRERCASKPQLQLQSHLSLPLRDANRKSLEMSHLYIHIHICIWIEITQARTPSWRRVHLSRIV